MSRALKSARFLLAALDVAQLTAQLPVTGERAAHLGPKLRRVVELAQVAELVDYQIILQRGREKENFVIEVEVAPLAAAPPPGLVVFDEHFAQGEIIKAIEVAEPRVDKESGGLFVPRVVPFIALPEHTHIVTFLQV